jgi:hypothetical protein
MYFSAFLLYGVSLFLAALIIRRMQSAMFAVREIHFFGTRNELMLKG